MVQAYSSRKVRCAAWRKPLHLMGVRRVETKLHAMGQGSLQDGDECDECDECDEWWSEYLVEQCARFKADAVASF